MNSEENLYSDQYVVTHTVTPSHHGMRLDKFLKIAYRKRSREQLKAAIQRGAITIERPGSDATDRRLKPSSVILNGDIVKVTSDRKPEPRVNFDYEVLYEDESIFVINKPANLPVHPAGKFFFHTLLIHLKTEGFSIPLRSEKDFYLVHRIDRETSGVLILAKDRSVCANLIEQFAKRKTKKKYLAITHGHPNEDRFVVNAPLGRRDDALVKLKMYHVDDGQEAITDFIVLERFIHKGLPFSLVECHPKTGRQHQIRAHLDLSGHPIVGDKLYGLPESEAVRFYNQPKKKLPNVPRPKTFLLPDRQISPEVRSKLILERHALHAAAIEFLHPVSGASLYFEANLPKDLRTFMSPMAQIDNAFQNSTASSETATYSNGSP